uniref:Predicted membrane protein (DUF2232) n=1 Tax=Candidatus Kentrum eta TaxID=2126337 RepID=A0A450UPS7_9GAMM|nr:MAG: Predicted membrane protein (DUF2232) [Candidatus Kentron sp. H]VFJ95524.1 MAG: Predicted membrane protein (DUF2232) [Candidatus Kentron sp. H]VFK01768.1 MAG: Predicted membrane protein (DUF2232) [Candidatus Kentron sp. H]
MRAFLSRIMEARPQAIIVSALSLVFPPFGFIGGGIIGLATLKHGLAEGSLVAGAAIFLAGVITWFVVDTTAPVIMFAVITGVPVLLLATTLRITRSLATTITVAGLLGVIATIGLHIAINDPLTWWRDRLYGILLEHPPLEKTSAELETLVDALAPMMIALPAGAVFGALLTLFLARWWHAVLDNPGGFGNEFRALRLDRRLAITAIAVVGMVVIFADRTMGISSEFLQIFIILYLFQGLAIAHGVTAVRGASTSWLTALYILLLLIPTVITNLLVITGLLDTWLDFRARAAAGGQRLRKL